jgi:hypothetical protein
MKEMIDDELGAATEDALKVRHVTIVEMLFLFFIAAIVALVAFVYHG